MIEHKYPLTQSEISQALLEYVLSREEVPQGEVGITVNIESTTTSGEGVTALVILAAPDEAKVGRGHLDKVGNWDHVKP